MPVLNDVYAVTFRCRFADQLGINVRHWLVGAVNGEGQTEAQIVAHFATTFSPLYKGLLSVAASYERTVIQKVFPLPLGAPVESAVGVGPGLVAGDALPKQVAGLISLRTAFAGRRFRGRSYIPFPAEADSENGASVTANYTIGLVTLGEAFVEPYVIGAADNVAMFPVLFHADSGQTTPLTVPIARSEWATQRRRGSFGRPNPVP